MSKRTIAILAALATVVIALVFYVTLRDSHSRMVRSVSPQSPVAKSSGTDIAKKKAATVGGAARVSSGARKQYSAKEYRFLRQRYRPPVEQAYGPVSESGLKEAAKYITANTPDQKLLPAINDVIYGKTAALEDKLDTGLSPNATFFMRFPTNFNMSLLDVAIETGQRSIIKKLLADGASANPLTISPAPHENAEVEAPLPLAASYGEDDVIRLFLRWGANINQVMSGLPTAADGRTASVNALGAAMNAQDPSTVYLLLTHGADVNSVLGPSGVVPRFLTLPGAAPQTVSVRNLLIQFGAHMPSRQGQ